MKACRCHAVWCVQEKARTHLVRSSVRRLSRVEMRALALSSCSRAVCRLSSSACRLRAASSPVRPCSACRDSAPSLAAGVAAAAGGEGEGGSCSAGGVALGGGGRWPLASGKASMPCCQGNSVVLVLDHIRGVLSLAQWCTKRAWPTGSDHWLSGSVYITGMHVPFAVR